MRFTSEERQRLISSLVRGIKAVRYADRAVEYHSIKDTLDLLNQIDVDLTPRRSRVLRLYSVGKGL